MRTTYQQLIVTTLRLAASLECEGESACAEPTKGSALLQAKAPLGLRVDALSEDSFLDADAEEHLKNSAKVKKENVLSGEALEAAIDAELAKEESTYKARALLSIEGDLTTYPAGHYLAFVQSKSLGDNIDDAFEHFMDKTGIGGDLSDEEREAFKERFIEIMSIRCKRHNNQAGEDQHTWMDDVKEALDEEKPVITKTIVDAINKADSGWTAKWDDWMMNISKGDSTESHGLEVDEPVDHKTLLLHKRASIRQRLLGLDQVESSAFNSLTQWPGCAEIMSHIRDQGRCGSCWAFAAATAIDGRMCVATGGGFNGPHSYISAGYLASCVKGPGKDGCGGGDPGAALRWMSEHGAPTGFARASGCSPYFASGDATQHMSGGNIASPTCPTSCELDGYQRSLQSDLFKPTDLGGTRLSFTLSAIKRTVMDQGPTPIALLATSAFHGYSGGVFNPGCNLQPNHAVTMYGWQSGAVFCLNSYGTSWGDNGKFKLAECAVSFGYTVPAMDQAVGSWPLPLPAGDVVPSSPARRRRAPPPGQRSTTDGCVCKQTWEDSSSGGSCQNYCCNPDSDPGGEWCFAANSGSCGSSWGYCAPAAAGAAAGGGADAASPVPMPVPVPVPAPVPAVSSGPWSVTRGDCTVDTQGCIKSPNYPNKYLPDQGCEIAPGDGSKFINVVGFSTEANFDTLEIDGTQWSGSTSPQGQQPKSSMTWSSDVSGESVGWKLCPVDQAPPAPPPPPVGTRRRWQPPAAAPTPAAAGGGADAAAPTAPSTRRRWQPPPSPPGGAATRRRYVLHEGAEEP